MTRSYLQFNILFELHYGPWQRSYLQFKMLFVLHYGPWQGLTYNLSYCLSYIMDHDNVLPTIYHIVWVTLWTMTRSCLQFIILFELHYGSWQRSYLQFCILFVLHYGSWQRSYLQFNILFELHYGSWQRAYCLGYIMDHDKVLPTI